MKEKCCLFGKGLLTAYAFLVVFHEPLAAGAFEERIDFLTASVYELLGSYDIRLLFMGLICAFFYGYVDRCKAGAQYSALACLFSAFLLLGNSYHESGSWDYCFGSVVNFLKTALAFSGYSFFFSGVLQVLDFFWGRAEFITEKKHFFSSHAFLKAFGILVAVYLPFILLSYPGNLCWDVIGQIEQVTLGTGYSSHHPLVHTLLVGGLTQLGMSLFGAYEIGLFAYMLVQMVLFAASLAATIAVLAVRGVKFPVLTGLLALYILAPVYTNIVSTAVKDVPFMAFVIGYVICLYLFLEKPDRLHDRKFVLGFLAVQLGMILFRNNGLYVAVFGGAAALLYVWKCYSVKERLAGVTVLFAGSVIISKIIVAILMQVLNATPGSSGEMLSIPFQQTARYLQLYQHELTEEEKSAIEGVLGDVSEVAAVYDPDISDPVKAMFQKDASAFAMVDYFITWFKCFFKHPAVYFEAFFHHIYGWFDPAVTNFIRYEAQYDLISQEGLFPDAQKLLLFFYRFVNRFTPLGVLENVGIYVWGLFFVTAYSRKRRDTRAMAMTMPQWISLLICMASPCFFMHPRYAFPIMFTLPFLICFMLSSKKEN